MKRLIVHAAVGLIIGSLSAIAYGADGGAANPDLFLAAKGSAGQIEVEMECPDDHVIQQVSMIGVGPAVASVAVENIATDAHNPLNNNTGIPPGLESVSDRVFVDRAANGGAKFVAIATEYDGRTFIFDEFHMCRGINRTDYFDPDRTGGFFDVKEGVWTDG